MNAFMKTQKDIEKCVVSGYKKIEDKFVNAFLTPEADFSGKENQTDIDSQQKNN